MTTEQGHEATETTGASDGNAGKLLCFKDHALCNGNDNDNNDENNM